MKQDDCSRRAFLKKFAVLSAGTLVLGATTMACYGPGVAPVRASMDMYFLDGSLKLTPLRNNQNVPVHTTFTIYFFYQMNTAVAATLTFVDQNAVPVTFDQAWDSDRILSVVPTSDLSLNTGYTLNLLDAEAKTGGKINFDGNADATFKTVAV